MEERQQDCTVKKERAHLLSKIERWHIFTGLLLQGDSWLWCPLADLLLEQGARRGHCRVGLSWLCCWPPVSFLCFTFGKTEVVSLSSQKCNTTVRNGLVLMRTFLPIMRILGKAVKTTRKHKNVPTNQNSWIF